MDVITPNSLEHIERPCTQASTPLQVYWFWYLGNFLITIISVPCFYKEKSVPNFPQGHLFY